MEKIIVNPRQVRALGDVVSPKGVADFEKYCCTLTESTDASFGDLYTSEFLPGARLVIDYPGSVSVDDDDFTVDVLLKDDSGSVISGASVYCDLVDSSATTDSLGKASFTIPCDGESSEYRFRIYYAGTGSLAGAICRGVVTVVDYESVDFSLLVDNPVLCSGEFAEFVAKLDELNSSGVMVPVSGAVVEFYMDVDVEPASISLVSSKDILSYADGGDSCTLTATVLGSDSNPYEGATVVFKAYKGGTLVETIGSDTTDSSGVATVSYSSAGRGDLNIKASVGSLVSEIYSIRDAIYYNANNITSATTLNIPNIPTNFKCLFNHTASASQNAWIEIGSDSSNTLVFGRTGVNNQLGLLTRVNGSYVANQTQNGVFTTGTETEVEYTYENGLQTIKANGTTLTITNSSITSRTYSAISNYGNGNIKGLTILPL